MTMIRTVNEADFDRFDICEGYYLAAHDWGCYGIISRLKDMHFKASPLLSWATLTDNGRAWYQHAEVMMQQHFDNGGNPWDRRLCAKA